MRSNSTNIPKMQTVGFVIIYTIIFALIVTKAFSLPITHDEAWTVKYLKYSVWDIMMYPDAWPNNHILNTLLTKFSCSIFGVHDWSVRIPNLLFFPIYSWGVYRFLKHVAGKQLFMFLPAAMLFVISPYFLDFFGLCRGYGISSALTMLSLSFLVTGFMHRNNRHIWYSVLTAIIASYANFTVLMYCLGALSTAGIYFMIHRKNWKACLKYWLVLLVLFGVYVAIIAVPIIKMKSTGQFVHWTSKGFYDETIFWLIQKSLSDSRVFTRPEWISTMVLVTTILFWIFGLILLFRFRLKREAFKQPLIIVGMILLFTVLVNLVQTNVLGDPNLNGRTALFLLPIYTSFMVTALMFVPKGKYKGVGLALAGLIVLVVIQHQTTATRMKSFKEWRYDAHTFEVIDYIKKDSGGDASLQTYWMYYNSFDFYRRYDQLNWLKMDPYLTEINSNSKADYYYVFEDEVPFLESDYEIVKTFEGGHTLMKRRKKALS